MNKNPDAKDTKMPFELIIRKARTEDAKDILQIHQHSTGLLLRDYKPEQVACWVPANRTADYYIQEIENPDNTCLIAEIDGKAIAFAVANGNYINKLYTHADYNGYGAGRKIFEQIENLIRKANYSKIILNSTLTSVGFYQHMGMVILDRVPYQFDNGVSVDIVKMEKNLEQKS